MDQVFSHTQEALSTNEETNTKAVVYTMAKAGLVEDRT